MDSLIVQTKVFWRKVLKTPDARRFFRSWNARASTDVAAGAWSDFREGTFVSAGKIRKGTDVVKRLRDHLVDLQQGRCCYCKKVLQGAAQARPIEHILSQSDYWQYAFRYRNLAVACHNCNSAKSNNDWTSLPKGPHRYPRPEICADFFHPRYHSYDKHIRYVHIATNDTSFSLYIGLTDQGRKLCRNLLSKTSKRELVLGSNERLGAAMSKLQSLSTMSDDVGPLPKLESFIDLLNQRIENLATGL